MSSFEAAPIRLRHDKTCMLMKRFLKLPKWQQKLIIEDMETAFENRIRAMTRINSQGSRAVEGGNSCKQTRRGRD